MWETAHPKESVEIRYFARADEERQEAQKIIKLCEGWGVKLMDKPIKAISKPWQYEIWFGADSL